MRLKYFFLLLVFTQKFSQRYFSYLIKNALTNNFDFSDYIFKNYLCCDRFSTNFLAEKHSKESFI